MPIKTDFHIVKGMQKDFSASKFNSEFIFDAMNIRITAINGNTLMSVTNEKGTKELPLKNNGNIINIEGTIIGYNTLNNYIILFTTSNIDRIYRLEYKEDYFETVLLYDKTSLNFNVNNPIESISIYENEYIQKIYWTDGLNQPRVINIVANEKTRNFWNEDSFDFVQELNLKEVITVERVDSSNGIFSPGTIQYAFTYYNKYGQESNIFYTTEINYISYSDRGGSPEDRISNSFNISIKNIDNRFEYIRIYSIHRTSIDSVPTVLKIIDLPIDKTTLEATYLDNGTLGETVGPTELLYIGGESIIAQTITHKDNTLFLGNLGISRPSISEDIKNNLLIADINSSNLVKTSTRKVTGDLVYKDSYYKYSNSLNKGNTAGFKSGEIYRLGLQFQYKTGKWSEPVLLGDYITDDSIRPDLKLTELHYTLEIPQINYILNSSIGDELLAKGYKRVRPVVVFPNIQDRRVLIQGMLCPTVFNLENRNNNTPFSQSSWFLRPNLPWQVNLEDAKMDNNKNIDKGAWVEFRHHYGIINGADRGAEIQNISSKINGPYSLKEVNNSDNYPELFMVDQSIVTMHSPDIEFDTSLSSFDFSNMKLRIVGAINFTSSIGDIDIQTSSPVVHPTKATGFVHKTLGSYDSDLAARSLVSGLFYRDWLIDDTGGADYSYFTKEEEEVAWLVYPWQKSGSINNDINNNNRAKSSVLSKKKISNLKYSSFNSWFSTRNYWYAEDTGTIHNGITKAQLFNSNEVSLTKIPIPENAMIKSINYYGNIDTLLSSRKAYNQFFTGALKKEVGDTGITYRKWVTPSFTDTEFNTIADVIKEIGDYNNNLIESKDPIRMKYKSSPHLVFSLNYTSESSSQLILPTTYGTGIYGGVNKIEDSTKPFWFGNIQAPIEGTFTELKWVHMENYDPGTIFPTSWEISWEDGDLYYDDYNDILYKYSVEKQNQLDEFPFEQVKVSSYYGNNFKFTKYNVNYYYEPEFKQGSHDIEDSYILRNYATSSSGDYEFSIKQDVIGELVTNPYLFLAELYRDEQSLSNAFGGKTEDALKSNLWIPAGTAIDIKLLENTNIDFVYGDTWYQRYDCLKTYPYTLEDENSLVEIGSFMCETRINIDGRYDRNRGQISNLTKTPNNFNLFNPVYSQKDNFFNYRILDKDYYILNKFSNTITWTKEKQLSSDIDTWTNITMASTIDLDGDKGVITSLNTFNNEIFCFQESGLSNILFNSRVQIPTSDGVPIEITNGFKVQGKRYINNNIGCTNKWSIVESPAGLYFIDDNTKTLYLFDGSVNALSNNLGFSNWFKENSTNSVWNPNTFDNFISYYDKNNRDVYFVNKNTCLCFSEIMGQFTSFMSYNNIFPILNIDSSLYSFNNNKLWKHYAGEYNMFYGEYKPYYITFLSNSDALYDKIFNTVEFRADSYDNDYLLTNNTFDTLEVWNEYQYGKSSLNNIKNIPSPLKRKFRIWRANIPRDISNNRDRIRNTWAYIKLGMNTPNTWKTIFHDASVHYFV